MIFIGKSDLPKVKNILFEELNKSNCQRDNILCCMISDK